MVTLGASLVLAACRRANFLFALSSRSSNYDRLELGMDPARSNVAKKKKTTVEETGTQRAQCSLLWFLSPRENGLLPSKSTPTLVMSTVNSLRPTCSPRLCLFLDTASDQA